MKKLSKEKVVKFTLILSILGIFISGYLLYSDIFDTSVVCPTNGCNTVKESVYSHFLGLPVAFWGLGYYLSLILSSSLWLKKGGVFGIVYDWLLGIGAVFTIYLRYLEIFKIGSFCIWCWGSVVVLAAIIVLRFTLEKESNTHS